MMKEIVATNRELCVGCNRCIRECPIEMANLAFLDEDGNIKVRVDSEQCVACGACLSACKHNARTYVDDLDALLSDLKGGIPVSLIVAPSIRSNIPDWRRLLCHLRELGVRTIYDASMGADICTWAHLRYIEENQPVSLISQPCASIVTYCEKHRPELLKFLSPVKSPIGCTATVMRQYKGIQGRIAALTPCIAKSNEFASAELVDYNITFHKLLSYLDEHQIRLPERQDRFDNPEAALGSLFPSPGGLKENLEFFTGRPIRVDRAEGQGVYPKLDAYINTPPALLPKVFDVLNCADGCNIGSAGAGNRNFFEIESEMDACRQGALKRPQLASRKALYESFDKTYRLADFLREYVPAKSPKPEVTEADINLAFAQLGKDTLEKQNFDCGACGSHTCRDMARKIAMGVNIPLNCIVKSRDDLMKEHEKNTQLYERNTGYLELIHDVGEGLLSMMDEGAFGRVLESSIGALCNTFYATNAFIWRHHKDADGRSYCLREYGWSMEKVTSDNVMIYADTQGEMFSCLLHNRPYNKLARDMPPNEQRLLPDQGAKSILDVPIFIRNSFWGFISMHSEEETVFKEEDISVVVACGLLIVSSIIEHELNESLILAREQALAGTQSKSDFLSRMSHEMRTPMNAIIGMTQIAGNTDDVVQLRHCLNTIEASSTHLLGLINDVLDMSKIEAGKLDLDLGDFSMEKMLMKITNLLIDKTVQKKQKLNVFLSNNLHSHYIGDEMRLSQVVTNLLTNAVKFTPEGGRITLSVETAQVQGDVHRLRFTVSDTGIGMNEEQLGRLFRAFEQAESGTTKKFGGTGLGLAISKSFVEKMNGRIWAESQPGKGSDFIFEVELARKEQPDTQVIWGNIRPADVNVLIADGDTEAIAHFESIIGKFGIRSSTARGTEDVLRLVALARAEHKPYDVLFMDQNLLCGGAEDFTQELCAQLDRNTVIVMTSFLEWSQIEKKAKEAGVSRFIAKPLFPSTVLNAIIETINGAAQSITVEPSAAKGPDFSNVRLLLGEDIEINREIFMALLEHTGIQIDTAENGRIAVERFMAGPDKYDLIVMDIQMPEMDGYEATRMIRSLDMQRAKTIPIVAMTANAFKEDIERCLACGMNAHLSKPIDVQSVIDQIAHFTKDKKKNI